MTAARPVFVIAKAMVLFMFINVLYALVEPAVYKISAYNILFPGRARLPFSNGNDPYVVMVDDVNAMFAVHSISGKKDVHEIRVVFIGDSSVWGEDLSLRDTLSEQMNRRGYQCGGKTIKAYNLGYPHPSILKDLILIEKAKQHQPDLIIWLVTLNTVASHRTNPFLITNRDIALQMLDVYELPFMSADTLETEKDNFFQQTLVGQRSYLARLIKLQALGAVWLATEKDASVLSGESIGIPPDVRDDVEYRQLISVEELDQLLLWDALSAGYDIAGKIPVLLVNEPMYISTGVHSDLRYNDFYPRWAYDHYREGMANEAQQLPWAYLDLWDAIPREFFSNTPLHLDAQGERLLMEQISPSALSLVCD